MGEVGIKSDIEQRNEKYGLFEVNKIPSLDAGVLCDKLIIHLW